MEKAVPFDEALLATGYGKFNIALVLLCGTVLYVVNADSYSIGYLLPVAQCDLNLTTFDKGILTSASFFGMICSSFVWGFMADTRGRKNVIILTLIASFSCTFINSFLTNFWLFTFARYLSGVFMAGASTTVYAYLGEFHSDKHRAVSITLASIFVAIAIIALPGIAWTVIPQTWSFDIFGLVTYKPWRLFIILNSLPGVFVSIILFFFPESPKFLMMQGDHQKTLEILRKVYAMNTGKNPDSFPVKAILDTNNEQDSDKKTKVNIIKSIWVQTAPMFRKPLLLNTFISCFSQFGLFAVSSALLFWYPEIVNQLAEHERKNFGNPITVCEAISSAPKANVSDSLQCSDGVDSSVFEQNLIIGGGYGIGFIIISMIVNIVGKKSLLVSCTLVSGASGLALCWITYRLVIDYLFVGLLVLSGLSVAVINAAVIDIFPTYLRGMAIAVALMFGRLGSVIASPIFGLLMEYNCNATFIISAVTLFLCAAAALLVPNKPTSEEKQNPA